MEPDGAGPVESPPPQAASTTSRAANGRSGTRGRGTSEGPGRRAGGAPPAPGATAWNGTGGGLHDRGRLGAAPYRLLCGRLTRPLGAPRICAHSSLWSGVNRGPMRRHRVRARRRERWRAGLAHHEPRSSFTCTPSARAIGGGGVWWLRERCTVPSSRELSMTATDLTGELRHALRALRRSPAYTAAAVLTLALGIGASASVVSVASALFVRPLPFADEGSLVWMEATHAGPDGKTEQFMATPRDFVQWQADSRTLARVEAMQPRAFALTGGDEPETVQGGEVSAGMFSLL